MGLDLYVIAAAVSAVSLMGVGVFLAVRNQGAVARRFVWVLLAVSAWNVTTATSLLARSTGGAAWLSINLRTAVICGALAAWVAFLQELLFPRGSRSIRLVATVLMAAAAVLGILALTTDLIFTGATIESRSGYLVTASRHFGPLAVPYMTLTHGLAFAGLLGLLVSRGGVARRNRGTLTSLVVVFGIGEALHAGGLLLRVAPADPTPFVSLFGCGIFFLGILRNRFLRTPMVILSSVFDAMRDAVVVLDATGETIDRNRGYGRLLGDMTPSERRSLEAALQALALDAAEQSEVRIVTSEPTPRYLDLRASAVDRESGATVVVIADVTRDVELTAELEHYARTVAHDLRNPLSVVLGNLELLAASTSDEQDAAAAADDALAACETMHRIIDDTLLLARIRETDSRDWPALDVGETVQRAGRQLRRAMQGARVQLPSEWPRVAAIPQALEQVWVNLLSNALKHGSETPSIDVGWRRTPEALEFWVQDDGPGIPDALRARVFRPFERASTAASGHGLGLEIVQRLIRRHGGTCGVDGAPGGGSRFWFTLPRSLERSTPGPSLVDESAALEAER